MELEEQKEKYFRLMRVKNLKDESLKECLSKLPAEGLNHLYNFYDVYGENKETKQEKIAYLAREIPSQFLHEFQYMEKEEKSIIVDICNKKSPNVDFNLINMLSTGFIFIDENDRFIFSDELHWFIVDLFTVK